MSSPRSYLNAVLRDPDTMSDMVAPGPPGPLMTDKHDGTVNDVPVALVSTNSTAHISDTIVHPNNPDKYWDGDQSTLLTFLSELENTLSTHDTALHTFAIHYYAMLSNGKTVIALPGQAAQLDGAIPRPEYTWGNPAPEDGDSYGVDRITVTVKHNELYVERRLANPNLPDDPPAVPARTPYPVDKSLYVLSPPMLDQFKQRLRTFVLDHISDQAVRYDLSRRFTDGRTLIAHLFEQAAQGLHPSQVRVILDEIDALVNAGLTADTTAAFKAFLADYDRLLRRIPAGNAARDGPPVTAMKYIKTVVHNRPGIAQSVATHLRAGHVDQNDPAAVRDALISFLDDTAAMARLMTPATDIVPALAVKADPRKHTSNNRKGKPPSPCFHCGDEHWMDACAHADKGTNKHRIRQLKADIAKLESSASPPASADDKLALVTAKLGELANRPQINL
jgi:hypothetical protein